MKKHTDFLKLAIDLASENVLKGGGPFGALVVKDNQIIAQTGNSVTLSNDPTAHAEVNAIREACRHLDTFHLEGCTIYASCEPCPMCLSAIYWARIDQVFFAATRDEAAEAGFDDSLIYNEIPKAFSDRLIPFTVLNKEESKTPFLLWKKHSSKVEY